MCQLLINVLLAPAVVNKNNLHANCLSTHVFTKKTYDQAYFKDVTNSFLPAAALFCKHRTEDQDTLIEQSFLASISKLMVLPYQTRMIK